MCFPHSDNTMGSLVHLPVSPAPFCFSVVRYLMIMPIVCITAIFDWCSSLMIDWGCRSLCDGSAAHEKNPFP
ncbi:hypothetical protein K505DRAFT_103729 [Melanomma pulvis-pyrius CBS 109.77]|uniref:Uncharacterized protein n=1 Tax=Melanomma pulvis-pyrius CBS 109.77 TaxID=1314802 RepID=A0A6A6WWW1_9PLEO|nr:hypothetical protein K505DRAFT_103729 [Melanomma pulvis-pyrius CBS 109.77]